MPPPLAGGDKREGEKFLSEIQRALGLLQGPAWYRVRIDHGRFHVAVAQQLLDGSDVIVGLKQLGRKAVAAGGTVLPLLRPWTRILLQKPSAGLSMPSGRPNRATQRGPPAQSANRLASSPAACLENEPGSSAMWPPHGTYHRSPGSTAATSYSKRVERKAHLSLRERQQSAPIGPEVYCAWNLTGMGVLIPNGRLTSNDRLQFRLPMPI